MFRDKYKNNNYYIKKLEIKDFDLLYNIGRNPLIWEQHPEVDRWKEEKQEQVKMVCLDQNKSKMH